MMIFKRIKKIRNLKKEKIEARNLEKRVNEVMANLSQAQSHFEKFEGTFVGVIKDLEKKTEDEAKNYANQFKEAVEEIKINLQELLQILKLNKQIEKHLFSPIRKSQRWAMIFTIIFGLTGAISLVPNTAKWIKSTFGTKEIRPEYYFKRRLEIIRQYINNQSFKEANNNIDDLFKEKLDESTRAQASIYKCLIQLRSETTGADEKLKNISLIPLLDNHLEAQQILLTAIFHYENGEFIECDELLRKIYNEEKFSNFHLEAIYYRFRTKIKQFEDVDNDPQLIKDAENFINIMKEISFESEILDLTSGKIYSRQSLLNYTEILLSQQQEKMEQIIAEKKLQDTLHSLKIAIRYNINKLGNRYPTNKKVKSRAEDFYISLKEKYPKLNINFGAISKIESNKGAYDQDYYYSKNEISNLFLKKELIKKNNFTKLKRYRFLENLKSRYSQYDLVFIVSHEK